MLILDIKLLIFLGLAIIIAVAWVSSVITRRASRRNSVRWDQNAYAIFDTAPFGVMLYQDKRGLVYQNQFVQAMQPVEAEQHKLLTDLQELTRASVRTSPIQPTQTSVSLANGKTILCWMVGHGNGMATAYLLDMTQHRRSEAEVRNFIGTLSHELRTPLTVMLSHLQIARSAEFAADTREASLELVHREIRHTSHLVQEMTLLASLEVAGPGDLRPVDIVLIADDALSRVALVAEERQIGIELATETAIPRVLGHPERLLQVFINLLDNALKYCRTGDNVVLRLCSEPGHVLCQIQDSGPGIAAEHLPLLTQRLYRVRQDKEGHGLGLAIVEEILRGHHSYLEIESVVEGARTGTTMGFRLAVA